MKTAVIYARYSCDKQTEQSIEGQLRICNDYAARNEIIVVDTYIDRATTGTNDNRAAFQKMMKDSAKRAWDYVIVYKLDRFSRDKYESAMHRHTLKMNGVKLVSAMENIPDTPEGIILESLLEGMNQYYSAELSQKVTRGMRETRSKGNFPGGAVMYGYRVVDKKVVIHEDEAKIVLRIFTDYANGKPGNVIIDELNEQGVLYHGKPFAKTTFYRMVVSEKYAGIFRHGDEVYTNIYPAIVPMEIFEIVREKAEKNKYGKHKAGVCYLFKNKLTCGYCGRPVGSGSGTSKSGKVMRYYRCNGRGTKHGCQLLPVRKELLEELVVNAVQEALQKTDLEALADGILEQGKKIAEDSSVLNLLTTEYEETTRAIDNLLRAVEQGIFTQSTKDRLEQLEARKTELETKIACEKARSMLVISKEQIMEHLHAALKRSPKQLISYFIRKIVLFNDHIDIYCKSIENHDPDGNDSHREFSFYEVKMTVEIDRHTYGGEKEEQTYAIALWI